VGGREERKEIPVRVIVIGAMVVNARFAGGNRRISLLDGRRLCGLQDVAAGKLPVFVTLRGWIDEFIGPGIFGVAVVDDDAHALRGGSDAHIEKRTKGVAA